MDMQSHAMSNSAGARGMLTFPVRAGAPIKTECPVCGKTIFSDTAHEFGELSTVRCSCGRVFSCTFEYRSLPRKKVKIQAEFFNQTQGFRGRATIRDISVGGIGFVSHTQYQNKPSDLLALSYVNGEGTPKITRKFVVVRVQGSFVGAMESGTRRDAESPSEDEQIQQGLNPNIDESIFTDPLGAEAWQEPAPDHSKKSPSPELEGNSLIQEPDPLASYLEEGGNIPSLRKGPPIKAKAKKVVPEDGDDEPRADAMFKGDGPVAELNRMKLAEQYKDSGKKPEAFLPIDSLPGPESISEQEEEAETDAVQDDDTPCLPGHDALLLRLHVNGALKPCRKEVGPEDDAVDEEDSNEIVVPGFDVPLPRPAPEAKALWGARKKPASWQGASVAESANAEALPVVEAQLVTPVPETRPDTGRKPAYDAGPDLSELEADSLNDALMDSDETLRPPGRMARTSRPLLETKATSVSRDEVAITCPHCNHTRVIPAEQVRNIRGPVRVTCECTRIFNCHFEFRTQNRKSVRLEGTLKILKTGEELNILIKDLSFSGVGFSTMSSSNPLSPGETVLLDFVLDSPLEPRIRRKAEIASVSGPRAGARFLDTSSQADLTSYLMS